MTSDKARAAAQALADEISGLKVELAAMMKERDEESRLRWQLGEEEAKVRAERDAALADLSQARAERDEAEKARDTALADLSQARAERDEARDTHARAYNAASIEIVQFRNERDTAISRAESAEASAAAMRDEAIAALSQCILSGVDGKTEVDTEQWNALVRDAIADITNHAGRALLDRHAAELAQMRATVAASEAQTVDYAGRLGAADDVIAQLREENARLKADNTDWEEREAEARRSEVGFCEERDAAQALLGRAVAALLTVVRHAAYNCPTHQAPGFDSECDSCVAKNHGSPMVTHEVRAILADPTATAAADAYREQQEEREELLALARNMANPGELHGSLADTWVTRHRMKARDILAKVDARRGRGGDFDEYWHAYGQNKSAGRTPADRITRQMDTWHECKEPGEKCELHRKLEAELTEARDWVRKLTSETRVLTCVYCGNAYPPGTPSHGSPVLTEHIASCERHPLTIERAAHARTQAKLADVETRLLAAQGEAMEMHRALSWSCTCDNARTCRRCLAMDGKAGRALAERVPLWRALETAARASMVRGEDGSVMVITTGDLLRAIAALDEKPESKENT